MKRAYVKPLFGGPEVIFLATLILCSGCTTLRISTKPYVPGRILLLPPRDVVQNGVPHPKGVGSGRIFQDYLRSKFAGTAFEILTTDSQEFSGTEIAEKGKGLAEAQRLGANYCLQVVLGDFLDAAPMTFRPDYVYLDKTIMWDVRTGDAVWESVVPLRLQKGNLGSYQSLLDELAQTVAGSISNNMK